MKLQQQKSELSVPLHKGCLDCQYLHYCGKNLPSYSIFNLLGKREADVFYAEKKDIDYMNNTLKCLGAEMETFALFHNAKCLGKKAPAILTVSDHIRTGKETTSAERETAFRNMMEIALNSTLIMDIN